MSRHAAGDVADGDADAARPRRMATDRRKPALGLHQQVVSLHVRVGIARAIAGNIDGDQPPVFFAQCPGAEAGARGRARREVLDEHVGLRDQPVQKRGVPGILDVGDEALLAPVQPDEIGREPVDRRVVASREIALGAFDLDDARARVRETRRAIGRGDRLFEGNDEQAGERLHPAAHDRRASARFSARKRLGADMMLDALRIDARRLLADADGDQERLDDLMARAALPRHAMAFLASGTRPDRVCASPGLPRTAAPASWRRSAARRRGARRYRPAAPRYRPRSDRRSTRHNPPSRPRAAPRACGEILPNAVPRREAARPAADRFAPANPCSREGRLP